MKRNANVSLGISCWFRKFLWWFLSWWIFEIQCPNNNNGHCWFARPALNYLTRGHSWYHFQIWMNNNFCGFARVQIPRVINMGKYEACNWRYKERCVLNICLNPVLAQKNATAAQQLCMKSKPHCIHAFIKILLMGTTVPTYAIASVCRRQIPCWSKGNDWAGYKKKKQLALVSTTRIPQRKFVILMDVEKKDRKNEKLVLRIRPCKAAWPGLACMCIVRRSVRSLFSEDAMQVYEPVVEWRHLQQCTLKEVL